MRCKNLLVNHGDHYYHSKILHYCIQLSQIVVHIRLQNHLNYNKVQVNTDIGDRCYQSKYSNLQYKSNMIFHRKFHRLLVCKYLSMLELREAPHLYSQVTTFAQRTTLQLFLERFVQKVLLYNLLK